MVSRLTQVINRVWTQKQKPVFCSKQFYSPKRQPKEEQSKNASRPGVATVTKQPNKVKQNREQKLLEWVNTQKKKKINRKLQEVATKRRKKNNKEYGRKREMFDKIKGRETLGAGFE